MRILVEQYHYPLDQVKILTDMPSSSRFWHINGNQAYIPYVGYFYTQENQKDVVNIVLPKVFLDAAASLVGTMLSPTDLFCSRLSDFSEAKLPESIRVKIEKITLSFYLSIKVFRNRHNQSSIAETTSLKEVQTSLGHHEVSYLDVVLSLLSFHKKNRSLIAFTKAKQKSTGKNKVSWSKTIHRENPILQDGSLIYWYSRNEVKRVDVEEELLVMFYSVLNKIKHEQGFYISIDSPYTPLTGGAYNKMANKAIKRLKSIRNNYFSDKLVKLHRLLSIYFEVEKKVGRSKNYQDFIMVRDYHIVFEDMIDSILTDPEIYTDKQLGKLKNNDDGKIIDHIYSDTALLSEKERVYYIGDSKYYKSTTSIQRPSVSKQFTYAKNIIQYNIDNLSEGGYGIKNNRYRDELTEGYNITPNFFIQAYINDKLESTTSGLQFDNKLFSQSTHFQNRLFDRDTLFIHHYSINFLYVLNTYISAGDSVVKLRAEAKKQFRDNMIATLDTCYDFYIVKPNSIEEFISQNFRVLIGKMYRTVEMQEKNNLMVASIKPESHDIESFLEKSDVEWEKASVYTLL